MRLLPKDGGALSEDVGVILVARNESNGGAFCVPEEQLIFVTLISV